MERVLPSAFLFRWSIPASYRAELPDRLGQRPGWAEDCLLPVLAELDAGPQFATWSVAWNADGLAVAVQVRGKQQPVQCDAANPLRSDALEIWIDTRCTQNVHRATRFCHRFCALPRGSRKGSEPVVIPIPFANARETTSARTPPECLAKSALHDGGYDLAVWLPAEALVGFDPDANPRLGFYLAVRDAELGEQYLTVGREFPIDFDPSQWQTLELVK
uniref:Carbohydrate-binding domain-containing protein n=1 Tax=Schlesneria paludicola TaxID=360056 RepID=A0A7C2P8C2_9PLAN